MAGILTTQQQQEAWHDLLAAVFPSGPNQPPLTIAAPDLIAAVQAADAWVTANQASYVAALPAPFSNANATAKAALLVAVITRRFSG